MHTLRHYFLLISVSLIPLIAQAQAGGGNPDGPSNNSPQNSTPTSQAVQREQPNGVFDCPIEVLPEFPGGMRSWTEYLKKNLKYPPSALKANIQGRVIVSMLITKNGDVKDVKVLRGLGYGADEEAVRLFNESPKWKPGIRNGRPVDIAYTMPVFFKLE